MAAVCGTDAHIYNWDTWAQARLALPRILGHEAAGEVVAVGADVQGIVVGDLVSAATHLRRQLAARMGATWVLNPLEADIVEAIRAETNGDGVDVLLEMSGNATALRQGLQALTQGGRVSLLGLFEGPVSLDLNTANTPARERGTHGNTSTRAHCREQSPDDGDGAAVPDPSAR
jgi:threonine dehydrogenase-like Zn-dependent dehydrogenase